MTKPYKYHYYLPGWGKVLCQRSLQVVSRTTENPARVNCTACLADPFLAGTEHGEPAAPKVRCDGRSVVLDFTDAELAGMFEDWMNGTEPSSGWPRFGDWYDGKRD